MKFKKYLTEGRKFQSSYKEGDKIEVEAERRQIYANPGYVPSAKITKMTLIVKEKATGPMHKNAYTVVAKGKFTKVPQTGGKIPKSFLLSIIRADFGILSSNYPKPIKYEVVPV